MSMFSLCRTMLIVVALVGPWGCETPRVFTVTIEESPNRVVRLQTVELNDPDRGFSHPARLASDRIAPILRGLTVDIASTPFPLFGARHGTGQRAFSDGEIDVLAPSLAKGLAQATPEEVVTFYETADLDDQFRAITSGAVFAYEGALYVMLSNYRVKRPIWQDNEQYEAPHRLRPLDPIDPQPGRVRYERPELAISPTTLPFDLPISSDWVVGVRYTSTNALGPRGPDAAGTASAKTRRPTEAGRVAR